MAENLLRDSWSDLDQADLRLLLQERFGGRGQYDGDENIIHLPRAREQCRISLTYKGAKIVAIEPGLAFDRQEWDRICAEIEGPIMKGPRKVGREISFNTKGVKGWWRGERSGVQILPAPESALSVSPCSPAGQIRSCGLLAKHGVTAMGGFDVCLLRIARLRS